MVILQIGLAILWRLNGIVIARYIALILSLIIGFILIKNIKMISAKANMPSKNEIAGMIKFGTVMLVGNAASGAILYNETFLIGLILKSKSDLADYGVASNILSISLFLYQSVVFFVYPYFVKHTNDKQWVWSKFKKLSYINAVVMIPIHILLIIFSKLLILIVFGDKYLGATHIMQMLLVASLGQAIVRGIAGNILAGIGEESYNLKINVIFTVIHVLINIWALQCFGINGAAIALTIVYFASGIVMIVHLRNVCRVKVIGNNI